MSTNDRIPETDGDAQQDFSARGWEDLANGERVEFGLLQVDIVGHSNIAGSDLTIKTAKDRFREGLEKIAFQYHGKVFSWAGDGGCFMFLTGDGQGFNTLVSAAIAMLDALPTINQTVHEQTDLRECFRVRISCDYGTARYDHNPATMHAGFINSFLKHERLIAVPDNVCVTERVRNQLNGELRERFEFFRYSPEMGIDIYQLLKSDGNESSSIRPESRSVEPDETPSPETPSKKRATRYPDWVFLPAPLICLAAAVIWRIENNVVGLIILPVMMLVSIILALHKSNYESTTGQSLILSLVRDKLLPNESGGPLVFEAKVLVVADITEKGAFLRSLEREFERVDESNERNLVFVPVTCDESNPKKQAISLEHKLEGASAVVIVRTKELEFKDWLYKYIDDWAYERSEIPIVFTELERRHRRSKIPEKYFSIPLHAKSLPWRLLQRAKERGFEWRGAARYNRVAVGVSLIMTFASAMLFLAILPRQKRERRDLTANNQALNAEAGRTLTQSKLSLVKEQFDNSAADLKANYIRMLQYHGAAEKTVPIPGDNELQVSYWFNFENEARQFASTEIRPRYKAFGFNKNSAIGNAFVLRNHVAQASLEGPLTSNPVPIRMWKESDVELFDPEAVMYQEEYRTIKSIVCATHTGIPETETKYTVGICVFTESDKPIFRNKYRTLLREEVRKLYARARPHIESNELAPLPK